MFEVLVMLVITLVMSGLIVGITPYVMRRNIYFGVMLEDSADQLPVVKKWKKQFFIWSISLSMLSAILLIASFIFLDLDEDMLGILGVILIFMPFILQGIIYVYFHGKAKELKEKKFSRNDVHQDARIMVSTDFHQQKMIVSNGWFVVLGGIIILVTAFVPVFLYDQIPDYIPRHLDHFDNDLNQLLWIPKSPRIFMILPFIQFAMLILFIFINYMLKITKQLIVPKHAKRSVKQNRAYRYAMSKVMFVYAISLILLLAIPQFLMIAGIERSSRDVWIVMGWLVSLFVLIIYVMLKYGQGGERYKPSTDPSTETDNEYQLVDDDKFWKLGVFYSNPNDPAIFVEKRFGIGPTVNFAKWQAWACMIGIFVFIGIIIVITMFLELG